MPTNLSAQRWRAVTDLTVERRGEPDLVFPAGEECKGAPENWPPKWLVDQELVCPIEDEAPAAPSAGPAAEKGVK